MNNFRKTMFDRIVTLLVAGLSFVAALAWNDAVQAVFQELFPHQGSLMAKFIYAIFVTMAVALVSFKVSQRAEKEEEKK